MATGPIVASPAIAWDAVAPADGEGPPVSLHEAGSPYVSASPPGSGARHAGVTCGVPWNGRPRRVPWDVPQSAGRHDDVETHACPAWSRLRGQHLLHLVGEAVLYLSVDHRIVQCEPPGAVDHDELQLVRLDHAELVNGHPADAIG